MNGTRPDRAWITVTALAAMALLACPADAQPPAGSGPPAAPPATVRLALVQNQELQDRWEVVGRLREARRAVVAAEVLGRIIDVPEDADEGRRVLAGQTVLARIDPVWTRLAHDEAAAQLQQAQAAVAEAQAQLDLSRRDLQRLEELLAANSAKPKEVDDARARQQADEARLRSALARVEAARVQVHRAQAERDRLEVVAPFDGYVVRKMVEKGQWANPGTPVAEIISRGRIDAEIDVPERLVGLLAVGQELEIQVEPLGRSWPGQVRSIVPSGSTAARTFPVRVSLDDQDGLLKAGMSVTAKVPTGQPIQTLTVPRDAVIRSASGTVVWTSAGGAAVPMNVDVLFGHEDRLAVRTAPNNVGPPLAAGMPVVIEGGERLFPGRPLVPVGGVGATGP